MAGLVSRRSIASGSNTFYTFDVQGSTAQRLDLNGNVLGSYGFNAYGMRASTDNSSDPYNGFGAQFGYYRDAETGLSLLGERYYDPGQGRFLNRDPSGYDGGLNLYGYVYNNPMGGIDPEGLQIAHKGDVDARIPCTEGGKYLRAVARRWFGNATKFLQNLAGLMQGTMILVPDSWARVDTFVDHYNAHARQVGATSPEEYAQMAQDHLANENQPGMESLVTPDGWKKVYDPAKQILGVYDASGKTETFTAYTLKQWAKEKARWAATH